MGAALASSVMSPLARVTQKSDGLNGKIWSASQAAAVTGRALELAAKRANIEACERNWNKKKLVDGSGGQLCIIYS